MRSRNPNAPVPVFAGRVWFLAVAATFLASLLAIPALAWEMRTWTSSDGKFKIKAEFVKVDGDTVVLKNDKGKTVKIPLKKLSGADQKKVAEMAADASESPFEESDDPVGEDASDASSEPDVFGPADRSSVEQIPAADPESWSYEPDPAPALEGKMKLPLVMQRAPPKKKDPEVERLRFHDGWTDGVFAFGRSEYLVGVTNPFLDKNSPPSLLRFDLSTGKGKGEVPMPKGGAPSFASPDGSIIIGGGEWGGIRLPVMSLGEKGLKRLYDWEPLEKGHHWDFNQEIKWIADERVAVLSTQGNLDVWSLGRSEAKFLYSITGDNQSVHAVSRGGKYLALTVGEFVYLAKSENGEIVGRLAGLPGAQQLSFSPDGKSLAVGDGGQIRVYDLATQQPTAEIPLQSWIGKGSIEWPAPDWLFAPGNLLIHVPTKMVAWQFIGGEKLHWHGATAFMRSDKTLSKVKLPHQTAVDMVKKVDVESMYVVKPGTKIALVVNVQNDKDTIIKSLTEKLAKSGIEVVQSATIALICEQAVGETRTTSYRGFGFRGGEQTVSVTEKILKMRIMEGQQQYWLNQMTLGAPAFLNLKEGQTIEQAVAEHQAGGVNFFIGSRVPSHIVRYPNGQSALGTSSLRDAK